MAHLLNLFTASSWAHCSRVAVIVLFLFLLHFDVGAVARHDDGTAGLPAAKAWARVQCGVALGLVLFAD